MGEFYKDGATDPAVEGIAQDATPLDLDYVDGPLSPEEGQAQDGNGAIPSDGEDAVAEDGCRAGVTPADDVTSTDE